MVKKVNQKRITNSEDKRKLRVILRDPVARDHFLSDEGDLESAMLRILEPSAAKNEKPGLVSELDAAMNAMKRVPWTAIEGLKGNPEVLKRLDDAEALLRTLRKSLST